ncbi:hypothetical protein B1T45_20610 [Mycobacterium kansasii]|uniref:Uncharacterized protein n=3 Tax=Mycobacterium kansasii TaxID=1768 RepID=A0A1V3XMB4_MYCKA|nr:hypothetical protein MKAN_09010 [Mycobacterium kansasii ATCC 12478]ARG57781.1 hypothetical protein B1T43_20130 [Mycobacterium kansasii]EUA01578.1 hypothetical protein I547_3276 [Mycobacterium kansasii 824]EUA17840.1 hypothetical protein I545_3162 [Mycobacterium kansasii 662]ARG63292.1 hypothetical protein B1T45_20610 [Mycobacterium kansasii]
MMGVFALLFANRIDAPPHAANPRDRTGSIGRSLPATISGQQVAGFLRSRRPWWHTRLVLNRQRRFFYGYRPAVPVV